MANNIIEIVGLIESITFLSPKGFGIFNIKIDEFLESEIPVKAFPNLGDKLVKVVGFVGKDFEIIEGYKVKIPGFFDNRDEKYVSEYNKEYTPELEFKIKGDIDLVGGLESLSGLKAYLVRYIIGVGEKQADILIKTLGLENVIPILDSKDAISQLLNVKGIGQIKAETIKETWDVGKIERNILIELGALGLSMNKCGLVYRNWGSKYKEILADDPYRLTEIKGIGFAIADEVSMKFLGIGKRDDRRYAGIIEFVIREYAGNNGDTIISLDNIKEGIKTFIANDKEFSTNDIDIISKKGIEKSIEKKSLYQINDSVYALGYFAYIETQIARKIQEGKNAIKEIDKRLINYLHELKSTKITNEQLQAIEYAYTKKISIILGGAGTGKTYTVGNLINGLIKNNKDYFIVTPTNKAASRVREVNPNASVSTIHALLGIKPGEDPMYNEDNQLPYEYLVIDETSMLDNKIANKLLNAINFEKTSIIFVGDPRQLPPVDAGSFFYDLIESGDLDEHITILTEVKRSNNEVYDKLVKDGYKITIIKDGIHNIVANALNILDGKMPINTGFDSINYFSDFSYKEKGELDVMDKIKNTILTLGKKGIDTNKDFQLYIPTYKGNLGIPKINVMISDLVNNNPVIKLDRGQEFKYNDKVIFNDNDKELGLTKGDIGVIKDINPLNNIVIVDFYGQGTIELKNAQLDSLDLGYAISVHKAQGTEVKYGGILLLKSFYMLLNNQLFYTAYTRCKEKVFLFGEEDAYRIALKTHINARNTLLFHLLANTPIYEIYPNISRKNFAISDKELKQIKTEISGKFNFTDDETRLIKIEYGEKSQYSYYRYLYGYKSEFSKLNLFDGIILNEDDITNIEMSNIKFIRIKKYSSKSEKRGFTNKIVNSKNALLVEINSYDKEIIIN